MQDYEERVRLLLQNHLRSSRELLALRKQDVGPIAAQTALVVAQEELRRIDRIARDRCMARELREMASGIAELSRRLIRMKRCEFAGSGGSEECGGAAVEARLTPRPPSLAGRDAKPLPQEEE